MSNELFINNSKNYALKMARPTVMTAGKKKNLFKIKFNRDQNFITENKCVQKNEKKIVMERMNAPFIQSYSKLLLDLLESILFYTESNDNKFKISKFHAHAGNF